MRLAEQMAMAILRGDEAAAASLADMLRDEVGEGVKVIPPVRTITVTDPSRLRVLLTVRPEWGPETEIMDPEDLKAKVLNWLRGGEPLILNGLDLTLYELPLPVVRTRFEVVDEMRPGVGNQAILDRHLDVDLGENG